MVRVTMDRSSIYEAFPQLKPSEKPLDRKNLAEDEINALQNCMIHLCTDLTIYKQLYTSEESINALNNFNKLIFSRMQDALIERICLQIACLIDPPGDGSNKNLSLKRFQVITNDEVIQQSITSIELMFKSTGMRNWRNKVLAHLDLNTATGKNKIHIKMSYEEIERIVESIQKVVDRLREPGSRMDIMVQLPFNLSGTSFIERIKNA
jgi:AbiU2